MSFKVIWSKYQKILLIVAFILLIPILAMLFKALYCFGVEIGENWRILYENVLFS
ncbi:MAG: hypothetical protein PUC82_03590 [bacterium]|nr:hypothetical protein [bacterium]